MISLIVQLLITFPKLGKMFLKIRRQYGLEIAKRRYNIHSDLIDEWVRNSDKKSDS